MALDLAARLDAAARTQARKNADTLAGAPSPTGAAFPPGTTWNDWATSFAWRGFDSKRDSARSIGNPLENSLLFSALDWQITTFCQAPFCVMTRDAKGTDQTLFDHPLAALLKNPMPGWSRTRFWRATLLSRFFAGQAYWFKVRPDGDTVEGLQWLPHRCVTPQFTPAGDVWKYIYRYRTQSLDIAPEDMVVIRDGIDPDNPHFGFSRFRAITAPIATDEEVQEYENIMLHNLGVPGAVISPGSGTDEIKDRDGEKISQTYIARTTGGERGRPMVFPVPVKLDFPALSPGDFGLERLQDYVESRVSMVMKLPASLLQTLIGIKHMNAKASVRDSERIAWNWNITPTQDEITEEIDTQLLPDLGDPDREWSAFDRSAIEALREDLNAQSKRVVTEFGAGICDRAEARGALGLKVRSKDADVWGTVKPKVQPDNPDDPGDPNDDSQNGQ